MNDSALILARLERSVLALERRNRRLTRLVSALLATWLLALTGFAALESRGRNRQDVSGDVLRVRGLVVVDQNGTERVRIEAPLPDPIMLGKRIPRGGAVSGILLFDEEGNERSGYVTSDGYPNVFFTLDGLAQQHVLFLAEPQGAATLRMWSGDRNVVDLGVSEDAPHLKLSSQGNPVFVQPAAEPGK
jgi:hypothetical protein